MLTSVTAAAVKFSTPPCSNISAQIPKPPVTSSVCPVTYELSGEARKSMPLAASSAAPFLASGMIILSICGFLSDHMLATCSGSPCGMASPSISTESENAF